MQSQAKNGAKWSLIAQDFPNKTENQVKNKFYATIRKLQRNYIRECKEKQENNTAFIKYLDSTEISEILLNQLRETVSNINQRDSLIPELNVDKLQSQHKYNMQLEIQKNTIDEEYFADSFDIDEYFSLN